MNRVLFTHLTLARSARVCEPHSQIDTHLSIGGGTLQMDGWIISREIERVLLWDGDHILKTGSWTTAYINGIN